MVCDAILKMGLNLEDEIRRETQATFKPQSQFRANGFSVLDDIADHAGGDSHRLGGCCLCETVMGESVVDQPCDWIAGRIGDLVRIAWNGWCLVRFHRLF